MTLPAPQLKLVSPQPDAVERLYVEHSDRVVRAAHRVCGNMSDAEDVLQTVFLRLARTPDLDLAPSPAAYLHRAAVNAALDLLRARGRARAVPLDSVDAGLLASSARALDDDQIDREVRAVIRESVARLKPRAAELFALKYFEGYDNREIAGLLGTSPVVVAVLLHRARARVRADLQTKLGEA